MIQSFLKKHSQVISYLFFGVLTTLINYLLFLVCTEIFSIDYRISTSIAWVISVLLAYITNKKYVFDTKTNTKEDTQKEIISFLYYRIISLIFDIAAMWLMVSVLGIHKAYAKIVSNVIVVIINYIFSKLFIFVKSSK